MSQPKSGQAPTKTAQLKIQEGPEEVYPLAQSISNYIKDICKKLLGSNIHRGSHSQLQPQPLSSPAGLQRTLVASKHPEEENEGHHTFAELWSHTRLQHCPPASRTRRVTHQGNDKKMPVSHAVSRQPDHSACSKNAVKAPCHQSSPFTRETGVSSATRLLPEKLKITGSKEQCFQLQGMLSTHSRPPGPAHNVSNWNCIIHLKKRSKTHT